MCDVQPGILLSLTFFERVYQLDKLLLSQLSLIVIKAQSRDSLRSICPARQVSDGYFLQGILRELSLERISSPEEIVLSIFIIPASIVLLKFSPSYIP